MTHVRLSQKLRCGLLPSQPGKGKVGSVSRDEMRSAISWPISSSTHSCYRAAEGIFTWVGLACVGVGFPSCHIQ
jgi:hypothetical protein